MRAVDTMDARYVRVAGQGSAPIRFHRIDIRQSGKRLDAKVRRTIAHVAYIICMLAPEEADTILELPSRRVGRMFKAALRRTQKTMRKRRFQRRATSRVLRVQARDSSR